MITLEQLETTLSLKINIREDGRNEDFACSLVICENPVCPCTSVGFVLEPVSANPPTEDQANRGALSFTLDLEQRVIDDSKRKLEGRDKNYAKCIVKGFQEKDWQLLQREYIAYKTRLTEESDPSAIKTDFPVEEIEDGIMVPYHEILPFGRRLVYTVNGIECQLMDQYCLRAGCGCVDSSVSFVPLEKHWYVQKKNLIENVLINYKTRRWDFSESSGKTSFGGEEIRTAVEKAYPDLYKILRGRHRQLKELYGIFRNEQSAPKPAAGGVSAIVGRNAPCPCGSGKKYKRCCGK
jgi:hypothetical protein